MSNDIAIKVDHVSKTFKLPHEKTTTIKGAVVNFYRRHQSYERQEVLKDVSFEVHKGDFFGIVGRNGSGKSTLLKLLAGIYTPTKGEVQINGKLTPFIELGVGFNQELTGRENVFLNGALLGFNRAEMAELYDEIVRFAELEKFMDQKLKNYSSGMQVRLAFSIAIQAQSDILVLDEVLAVGDEAFQKKCFSYFDQLKREKRTVILVTHDMSAVERFCNKALLLNDGNVQLEGKPHIVAATYSRLNDDSYAQSMLRTKPTGHDFKIVIQNEAGKETNSFEYLDTMKVSLHWEQADVCNVGIAIFRDNGEYVFGPNTAQEKVKIKADGKADYSVKLNLNAGEYFIKAGLMGANDSDMLSFIEEGPHFIVRASKQHGKWGGVTRLDHTWR